MMSVGKVKGAATRCAAPKPAIAKEPTTKAFKQPVHILEMFF
jgi:hypothetical protein